MSSYEICIGKTRIGPLHPPWVIAELGYNFTTLEEALQSVDAAAEAGADAIKIQTFRAETVTTRDLDFPAEAGGVNQYEEFKRYEIDEPTHRKIFERARQKGLVPFSSPSHAEDVDLLERVGVDLYKIGSDDLTNWPLLRYIASKGKPIVFSSGMATLAEVEEAIQTFHQAGNKQLLLLHCVSNYPVKDSSILNMRVIESYRRAFPVLVGFSDHTTSLNAAAAAITLGAVAIERHFALDKKLPVPDAFFSADPPELRALVQVVRETYSMLGDGIKRPASTETQMRRDTRKSIIARRRISKGSVLREEDLIIKRPAHGILPRDYTAVVGRQARRDIHADEPITWDMV